MIGRKSLWAGIVGMTLTIGGVAVAANAGGEEEAPVEAAAPVTEPIAELDSFEVPDQGRDVEGEFPGRIEAPTTTTTTAPPTTTTTAPPTTQPPAPKPQPMPQPVPVHAPAPVPQVAPQVAAVPQVAPQVAAVPAAPRAPRLDADAGVIVKPPSEPPARPTRTTERPGPAVRAPRERNWGAIIIVVSLLLGAVIIIGSFAYARYQKTQAEEERRQRIQDRIERMRGETQ